MLLLPLIEDCSQAFCTSGGQRVLLFGCNRNFVKRKKYINKWLVTTPTTGEWKLIKQ
jgi:hypothetical protein